MESELLPTLMELGLESTIDPTKLASSTLKSSNSHIKLLKRNNIPLTEQSLTINTEKMLNRLIDVKGVPLTDSYKRQIGMTIKRLFPNADISLASYNKERSRHRSSQTRVASDEFMNSVRLIRAASVNIIQDVYIHKRIDDIGLYDASLGILLVLSTSLRLAEIRQLKTTHIPTIRANEPVGIKSKASHSTRIIAPNDLLLTSFSTIEAQRLYVKEYLKIKKSDMIKCKQQYRFDKHFIIITSADYMRKSCTKSRH